MTKGSHPLDGSLFPPVPFRQAETTTFEGDFFEEYQIATGACGLIGRSGKSTHTPFLPRDRDHIFRRKQHEPRKQAQNL